MAKTAKARLTELLRCAPEVIYVNDAADRLSLTPVRAAKQLSVWAQQGWLRRVGWGSYAPAARELPHDDKLVREKCDSVLAMFAPAYIGGSTAAKHWGLSKQKSEGIVIMTMRRPSARNQALLGVPLIIKHVNPAIFFGTKSILIKSSKMNISDIHRTMIDLLDDPSVGFSVEDTSLCFRSYIQRNDRDELKLIEYADQLGNGAVFKRLGFLAEQHGVTLLQRACKQRLTKGTAKLDPRLENSRLVTRWKLWIPDRSMVRVRGTVAL